MTRFMKRIGSLLVACLLLVMAMCGSTAGAEGLLEAMMDIALREGRTIEGTLRVEAGGLLASLAPTSESTGTAAMVSDLLENGLLRVRYTQVGEESIIGAALELRDETLLSLEARTMGEEIAVETNLLPGKTLVLPARMVTESLANQMPDMLENELMEALAGAAERYGMITATWAMQSEGILSMSEEPIPATKTRDAAQKSTTLRVTDAQWQELLRSFAKEFETDSVLQQALASQMGLPAADLVAMVQQMVSAMDAPEGNAVEATIYLGTGDQMVGMDVAIEPPASSAADASAPLEGSFAYSRLTMDAEHAADSYTGSFTWGGDSELQAQLYRSDKTGNQFIPQSGTEYGGRVRLLTPDTGALELEARGDIRTSADPMAETYGHTFDIQLSQAIEGADASDPATLAQAPLLSGGFALHSETRVVELVDFLSEGSFTLIMGAPVAAIHYTLTSTAYTPTEHPENTVVRLDALTSEEAEALTQELTVNAQMMLVSLLSPPELSE